MRDQKIGLALLNGLLFIVGTLGLIGGSMQSKAHSIRVPETKFDGIQCDRLIAVFKEAYLEAGFQFVKETKQGIVTTVVFHFSIPEYAGKMPAVASFAFTSPPEGDQNSV